MDRIKLAAGGAQAAADALVRVYDGHTAAEAAGRLRLDLRLGEGDAVVGEGLGLARVVRDGLARRSVEAVDGQDGVALVQLVELARVTRQRQALTLMHEAVQGHGALAAGREGAVSLHRFVHEGQSLTLARDPREFYELDKSNAVLPIDCFDAPARQTVAHDASKAKTFSNDRITFTEAQVKAEASRCLGCGVSVVDPNKCIGCGLCTTRCEFDAIHLTRDMPEASRMYRTEDKMKAILPHMVKRAAKITIKDIKEKCAK